MAIATMDALIAGLAATTAQSLAFHKYGSLGIKSGYWHSYFQETGRPAAASAPALFSASPGGEVPTSATTGAVPFTDPAGGDTLYLSTLTVELPGQGTGVATGGTFMLADRLWHCSGFSGTSTAVQSVNGTPAAISRPDATGAGAELWVDTYATPGTAAQTLTITYTNSAGTASRTATCKFPASANKGDCQPATLQAGDSGVKSVQSVQWGGSTGSVGNYGVTILRRVAELPGALGLLGNDGDLFWNNMPILYAGACLVLYGVRPSSSQEAMLTGHLRLLEG